MTEKIQFSKRDLNISLESSTTDSCWIVISLTLEAYLAGVTLAGVISPIVVLVGNVISRSSIPDSSMNMT